MSSFLRAISPADRTCPSGGGGRGDEEENSVMSLDDDDEELKVDDWTRETTDTERKDRQRSKNRDGDRHKRGYSRQLESEHLEKEATFR